MKKIYAIKSAFAMGLALMANVAFGQTLKVTSNGNPVSNGDVLEVAYEFEDLAMPEYGIDYYGIFTWDPHLEVASEDGPANLLATVTSLDNTSGFQICWPMGCKQVDAGKSASSSGQIDAKASDLQIHKEISSYDPNEKPTDGGSVRVTLECGDETFEVTVKCLLEDVNAVGENMAESNEPVSYYTLDGVKVENPTQKGMYIMRQGGKAKVFLKK